MLEYLIELKECSEGESAKQIQFIIDSLIKEDIEEPPSDSEMEEIENQDVCDVEIDEEIVKYGISIGETLLTSEFALGSEYDRAKGSYSVINFRLFKE